MSLAGSKALAEYVDEEPLLVIVRLGPRCMATMQNVFESERVQICERRSGQL